MMMVSTISRSALLAWAALVAATCVSWLLGSDASAKAGTVAVLVLAFLKTLTVGEVFMELHQAPNALRLVFMGWCVVVPTVLIGMYLAG
jgi:hypothetical protein